MFRKLLLVLTTVAVLQACPASAANTDTQTSFSHQRGHYSEPFELTIRAPAPGWSLLITTDGTPPNQDHANGHLVDAGSTDAIATWKRQVADTASIRVLAISPDASESRVITHSYIFPATVLQQSNPGNDHAQWGHSGPDWEMDPEIVKHKNPENRVVADDLLSIPALYISMSFDELWGRSGIYIAGEGEPRECSIELLNPAGDTATPNALPGLQQNGTIQVTGGSSTQRWKTDKLSLRLKFDHQAEFPVFEHARYLSRNNTPEKFRTLVLDARLNESWVHASSEQRAHGQHTRDQYLADLENDSGGLAPHGRHVHLYLAGIYWGMYNLHERPDQHFASHYLGGSHKDYDVLKHQWDDVVSGSNESYVVLQNLLDQPDISSSETYQKVSSLLDIEAFSRYMLLNYWAGNTDWSHQNWYASFNRVDPGGRWRFHSWDAEHTLKDLHDNVTGKNDPASPTHFHQQLMKNDDYRADFSRLVHQELKPGGLLDESFTASEYRKRIAEIDRAIRAESARWGDNRRRRPYTREEDWGRERDRILNEYLPQRTDIVLRQFREANWLQ